MSDGRFWTPPPGSIPTLDTPSLEGVRSLHLIGIGGAGMRNLARLFVARGFIVSGSDMKASRYLDELSALGVTARVGHDADALGAPDVVVVSSAIHASNPELVEARRCGIAVWARQQALAALAAGRRAVAVAGTHGKTTTTSMIAVVLEHGGADPSYLVGGDLNESGSGARHGDGDLFVFEADESDGSFLLVPPWVAVITNIEVDHVDFYPGGLPEISSAFAEFAASSAMVIACGDDPAIRDVLARSGAKATLYGFDAANDIVLRQTALGPAGAQGAVSFGPASLTRGGPATEVAVSLQVDGPHNLLNATAAIVVGREAGIDPLVSAEALRSFSGVHRRFELRGRARGAEFYDDYGHNPTEMAVTVATARRRNPRRLIALVQPHRHSRVQAMWQELGASVASADMVVVTDVFAAAQDPIPGVTGKLVVDGVQLSSPGTRTVYLPHRADVVGFLEREIRGGDLVVTMGCGDVWMLGDAVIERIQGADG